MTFASKTFHCSMEDVTMVRQPSITTVTRADHNGNDVWREFELFAPFCNLYLSFYCKRTLSPHVVKLDNLFWSELYKKMWGYIYYRLQLRWKLISLTISMYAVHDADVKQSSVCQILIQTKSPYFKQSFYLYIHIMNSICRHQSLINKNN